MQVAPCGKKLNFISKEGLNKKQHTDTISGDNRSSYMYLVLTIGHSPATETRSRGAPSAGYVYHSSRQKYSSTCIRHSRLSTARFARGMEWERIQSSTSKLRKTYIAQSIRHHSVQCTTFWVPSICPAVVFRHFNEVVALMYMYNGIIVGTNAPRGIEGDTQNQCL